MSSTDINVDDIFIYVALVDSFIDCLRGFAEILLRDGVKLTIEHCSILLRRKERKQTSKIHH